MKARFLILLCAIAFSSLAQNGSKPVVTSDVLKLATADQIEVSPDGTKAVMVVTRKAVRKETEYYYTRHLYMTNLNGGDPVQLTFGDRNDGQPTWSPDGKHIAFVRKDGDASQVWILPLNGGEAYPLTKVKTGASQPLWSPSGSKILFSSSIPAHKLDGKPGWENERPGRAYNDEPNWLNMKDEEKKDVKASPDGSIEEIRAWLAKNASEKNPRVLNRLQFQGEQGLQPEQRFGHLFVIAAAGGEATQLTSGFQSFSQANWSPDGTKIICTSEPPSVEPDTNRKSSIWIMNADGKGLREFLTYKEYPALAPSFSKDGNSILFLTRSGESFLRGQFELGVMTASGSNPTILTEGFDRDVSSPKWSADGKMIYFTASAEGDVPLYNISAKGGKPTIVIGDDKGVMDYDLKGDKIVYAQTEVANPWDVYMMSIKDKKTTKLTKLNADWLAEKKVTLPKEYWITRPDGVKVQYWVMEPMNRKDGTKYPTILNIHGGPTAMWGPSGFSMWHEFQMQVGWGYGLVFCNPRGSGGYGEDFKRGNYQDWGTGPANDILAALDDAASKHSWIDKDQYFVTGGSYAGYMVAWLVSQDQRFKAANAQRGVYDLTTFMGEGNAWRLVPDYFGYPWEEGVQKLLDANSPYAFIDKINTPLLIMHSDQDLRTGVIQSEMMYKSLKILGKPVEYIRYPDEGHELSRSGNPLRMMDRLIRIIEFFERYAKHPETPPAVGSN
ncbi:MAG: S9 family peptidase [Cyclobacteriaceae bacterium]